MQYKSLNESILSVINPQPKLVKEDIQTRQRKAEGEKDIKNLTGTYKRRIKKMAGIPNPHVPSNAADIAGDRAHDALTNLTNRIAKHETERRSTELYGHRGKIIKKKATVKEEQEYTELLETIIVAIANELNISPQTLIEEFSEQELSEGLRKKIMHGLKVAVTGGALLAGTVGAAHQLAKPEWTTPRHHSPSSQVQKADSKTTQSTSAAKAKAKAKAKSSDDYYPGQILPGVDNSSLFSN